MRCPSQSSQSSVHALVARRSIWRVLPQSEVKGEGWGRKEKGQERLVEYPGDLGACLGVRGVYAGPGVVGTNTAACHAASPAGSSWQRAASFLSAASTCACEARGDIFLQSRAWIPLLRLHIAPACHRLQRQEFYFKSSKRDHVSHLSTVTVMKDAFLLFSFPFPPHAVNITRGSGN